MFDNLCELLLKARLDKGITQIRLARKCGYSSPQFVSNWERKMCSAPMEKWNIISKELGVPVSEMVKAAEKDWKNQVEKTVYKKAK